MNKTSTKAELLLYIKELTLLSQKKEDFTTELITAYNELLARKEEQEKCTQKLISAYKEVEFEKEEKEKRTAELIVATTEIEKAVQQQKEYVEGLQKMMFMTSHKLRSPIANILGVMNHLENLTISNTEVEEMKGFLKQFAQSLDRLTRELTVFIYNEEKKFNQVKED